MHNTPEISVIMSVYSEPEHWLRPAIESILNQDYSNFELILINDNPNSELNKLVLNEYSAKDQRVRVVPNEVNIGLTKSLNKGLDLALAKYAARMDADDIAMPNRFSKQKEFLDANPDYILCGSTGIKMQEDAITKEMFLKPTTDEQIKAGLFYECPIIHSTLMFKRIDGQFLPYNTEYRYSQDWELVSQLAPYGKMFNFAEPLVYYRISSAQISTKNLVQQNKLSHSLRVNNSNNYLEKNYNFNFKSDSESTVIKRLIGLLKKNPKDKANLSTILYTAIFFSELGSFEKFGYALQAQPFIKLRYKRRVKLLLSAFKKFNEHKFI